MNPQATNKESIYTSDISVRVPNLLLVDDDRVMRMVMREALRHHGYNVRILSSAEEALDVLVKDSVLIDVVVLDRELPGMGGLELVAKMKADAQLASIPIVMLTGSGAQDEIQQGIDAGVHYYLVKPMENTLLRSVIESAIRERGSVARPQSLNALTCVLDSAACDEDRNIITTEASTVINAHDRPPMRRKRHALALIVEKDKDARQDLRALFAQADCEVFMVETQAQAMAWASLLPFSVIIFNMPMQAEVVKDLCVALMPPEPEFYHQYDKRLHKDFPASILQSMPEMLAMLVAQVTAFLPSLVRLSRGDALPCARFEAHAIKSAALNLGYFHLAALMSKIEHSASSEGFAEPRNWEIIAEALIESGFSTAAQKSVQCSVVSS